MRLTAMILTSLSLSISSAYADLERDFVAKMAKSIDYVETHQEAVWPGFNIKTTPVIILFSHFFQSNDDPEHIYALNFTPVNLPWQKLTVDNHVAYFLNENLIDPDLTNYEGEMHEVENQLSYIDSEIIEIFPHQEQYFNKLTESRAALYLKSESKIDKEHFYDTRLPYDGFYEPTNVKLMYLENAALNTAIYDKNQAEKAIQDAAAIHQYRQQLLHKDLNAYEYAKEVFTGLPYYISLRSQNLTDEEYINKTQLNNCDWLTGKENQNFSLILKCLYWQHPRFISSIYGRHLDQKLSSTWKGQVETQYKNTSTLIQDYYHMSDSQAKALTEKAMQNPEYEYNEIEGLIDKSIAKEKNAMMKTVNEFKNQPGIELFGPWYWNYLSIYISSIFGGMEYYLINTNSIIAKGFDSRMKSDDGEVVEYKHMPFGSATLVFLRNTIDNNRSASLMKLLPESQIVIDGITTTVGDFAKTGKMLSFKSLSIKDKYIDITVRAGTLDAREGNLKLKLANEEGKDLAKLPKLISESPLNSSSKQFIKLQLKKNFGLSF